MEQQQWFDRVVVLLNSTSADGDAGVGFAASLLGADGYMTLAVPTAGPGASGLEGFAKAEDVTISDAADAYLEQVAERLGPYRVNTRALAGVDLATELKEIVEESSADAAVVPASLASPVLASGTLSFPMLVVPEGPAVP